MKNIYVLGSKGMLGNYVSQYLSNNFNVVNLSRVDLDASKDISYDLILNKVKRIGIKKSDIIINCAGTIKPRVDELGETNAILVNSVFPRVLASFCEKNQNFLIHPTTDCVYTGSKGNYNENDNYDICDVYGMSKALGEPSNCTVIRTSIIGEEINNGRSLVEWVKSERNNKIFGYTNHYWNGLTCLQFAKVCEVIINKNLFWSGIRHIHSNKINKFDLVTMINKVYDLNISISERETEIACDRSMTSIHDLSIFNIPNLKDQIIEMKNFSLNK